ncbi:MAG: type IV pilin-like G/H family protein [Pyrinomonadaceae bacterium]|nr:type IV pilin-like G/H family protein [Pyrinomonadaceae bacterium]
MSSNFFPIRNLFLIVIFTASLISGCAVEAAKETKTKKVGETEIVKSDLPLTVNGAKNETSKTTIKIEPNSPADTVRVFYKNLRERKFREAMFLTNLRPAIEGLTDAELKELQVDFEPLAAQVPADIAINGEIISKDSATVTAKLPDNETDEIKLQEIKLRRENGVWTIVTVDEKAETEVKKEGKNYFFALRLKTHHEEARAMLERVHKAQMVYALQNGGLYGDMPALIGKGFLPPDIVTAATTGYNYQIQISADRKKYAATATPAVYGKTGKLSFGFEADGKKTSALKSRDNKGQPVKM